MKTKFTYLLALFSSIVLATSCKNVALNNEVLKFIEEKPSTINWSNKKNESEVYGFSANVSVYTMDSRHDQSLSQTGKYKITSKNIDGQLCTRVDYPKNGDTAISYMQGSKRFVLLDSVAGQVVASGEIEESELSKDLDFLSDCSTLSRINIEKVKETANRLAFDIAEDDGNYLELSLPSKYFDDSVTKRLSTRVTFDTNTDTILQTEIVEMEEDGKKITTTVMPVYEIVNDTPIRIAQVTTIETYNPNAIEVENPYGLTSLDDIQQLSEKEAKELIAKGELFECLDYDLGLNDTKNYTETMVEIYESIDINSVSNEEFRLLLEEV